MRDDDAMMARLQEASQSLNVWSARLSELVEVRLQGGQPSDGFGKLSDLIEAEIGVLAGIEAETDSDPLAEVARVMRWRFEDLLGKVKSTEGNSVPALH